MQNELAQESAACAADAQRAHLFDTGFAALSLNTDTASLHLRVPVMTGAVLTSCGAPAAAFLCRPPAHKLMYSTDSGERISHLPLSAGLCRLCCHPGLDLGLHLLQQLCHLAIAVALLQGRLVAAQQQATGKLESQLFQMSCPYNSKVQQLAALNDRATSDLATLPLDQHQKTSVPALPGLRAASSPQAARGLPNSPLLLNSSTWCAAP